MILTEWGVVGQSFPSYEVETWRLHKPVCFVLMNLRSVH